MGSCFSSRSVPAAAASSLARIHKSNSAPTAYVVSVNGDLRQYSPPITASQVLDSETSSSPTFFFLCSSDSLYFDQYIPALRPHDQLDPSQIYFLLPVSKLRYKFSASDMAALVAKATLAFQTTASTTTNDTPNILLARTNNPPPPTTATTRNHKHKGNPARISPLLLVQQDPEDDHAQPSPSPPLLQQITIHHTSNQRQTLLSSTPRPTILPRFSSRRDQIPVRSFRIRLTTIYEGPLPLCNT